MNDTDEIIEGCLPCLPPGYDFIERGHVQPDDLIFFPTCCTGNDAEWLRPSNTNGMSIAHEPWEQMDVFMVVLRRSKPKSRKSNVKH
jgi:hypothetical protein